MCGLRYLLLFETPPYLQNELISMCPLLRVHPDRPMVSALLAVQRLGCRTGRPGFKNDLSAAMLIIFKSTHSEPFSKIQRTNPHVLPPASFQIGKQKVDGWTSYLHNEACPSYAVDCFSYYEMLFWKHSFLLLICSRVQLGRR
jgi:hypothetical protein